jgi:hypothetical protein
MMASERSVVPHRGAGLGLVLTALILSACGNATAPTATAAVATATAVPAGSAVPTPVETPVITPGASRSASPTSAANAACALMTGAEAESIVGQAMGAPKGTINTGTELGCTIETSDGTASMTIDLTNGADSPGALAAFDRMFGEAAGKGATDIPNLGDSAWLETSPGKAGTPGYATVHVTREGKTIHVTVTAPGPLDQRIVDALTGLMPTVLGRATG